MEDRGFVGHHVCMLRCCVEPPAGHIGQELGLISYVGITLKIRTAVFMWQHFPSSPEIGE